MADESPLEIPLGAYCRASLADAFDADRIFDVTRRGLDYFHVLFDYPYPFGKYDQAFVPEYNLGAMENPGLVTFTESYVFKSRATLAQYEARANAIMHEMAHMWFGDLVTMFWWDDLWLKESFADYMGALAVAEALDSPTSWVTFANRRKSWAYVQDQLPSTHPIVADIVDLEAAKLNFDGITYAKGASVVKQLVAYAGFGAFTQAARAYFRTHAFGNTSLGDFLAALSTASGQDMSVWARQWLQTSGVPRLSSEVDVNDDGNYTSVLIRQSAVDPVTGETELRPHSLRLGLYTRDKENQLVRTGSVEVQVSGAATEIPELVGTAQPDLLLINDDDLSYALLEFDERSLETLLTGVDRLEEPLARAVCLAALWSNTRDAVLTAHEYVAVVQRAALPETGVGVLQIILQNAAYAIEHFAAPAGRERLRKSFAGFVVNGLHAAKPASDHQLVWARTAAALGRKTARHSELLRGLLDGGVSIDGLAVDAELRWLLWRALAAQGLADETELGAELERDNTGSGTVGFTTARSSMPRAEIKEEAWRAALSNTLSNDLLSATISGFQEGPLGLHEPYVEPYFREISRVWGSLGIEMSSRIVRELFPASQDMVLGSTPEDHPVVNRTDRWLERNVNAAGALRRIILEERDQLLRSLRAQAREASLTVQGTR